MEVVTGDDGVARCWWGGSTPDYRLYHDHEAIGARLVEAAGSHPATIDLVAEHGPAYETLKSCDRA